MTAKRGITGRMTELYDVFVDWPGRLGRELPGLGRHLDALGERGSTSRVLDVGCGTGRHVAALLELGHDAHGADASADMLALAQDTIRSSVGDGAGRVHFWRLGEPPPASLTSIAAAEPFDAVISMGNVWPSVMSEAEVSAACAAMRGLLRPGGLLLLGMKAHGVRRLKNQPYLALLKRRHEGRPLWFVRYLDFDLPPLPDGTEVCDLHMVVVAGGSEDTGPDGDAEALLHRVGKQRVWDPETLRERLGREGFRTVRVSGQLGDPDSAPTGDDVFASALVSQV